MLILWIVDKKSQKDPKTLIHVTAFALAIIFILVFSSLNNRDSPCEFFNQIPADFDYYNASHYFPSQSSSYPICSETRFGFDILDMAMIADLACKCRKRLSFFFCVFAKLKIFKDFGTEECLDQEKSLFDAIFGNNSQWKLINPKLSSVSFYDIYNPSENISIITVRGTVGRRIHDVIQDLDLFKEIAGLQVK